jgi:GT2 family glycosyltransferase
MANISAIVPATNRPETLAQCEAALRRSDSPPDEILLVDEPADAVLLHVLDRPRRRR